MSDNLVFRSNAELVEELQKAAGELNKDRVANNQLQVVRSLTNPDSSDGIFIVRQSDLALAEKGEKIRCIEFKFGGDFVSYTEIGGEISGHLGSQSPKSHLYRDVRISVHNLRL